MPDSCTRSMSFLSLRRSIELPQGMGEREVVAAAAQAADRADRQAGEIGAMAERLARLHVGKVHFDERNADSGHCVAQRDAGMGVRRRVKDHEPYALARSALDAVDQLALDVALEAEHLRAGGPAGGDEAAVDGGQPFSAVD